jgi:Flp pilus assembly pilin Flp
MKMTQFVTKVYVQGRENLMSERGQTMTEYALILAAVAVAALVAYQGLGSSISGLATNVASDL